MIDAQSAYFETTRIRNEKFDANTVVENMINEAIKKGKYGIVFLETEFCHYNISSELVLQHFSDLGYKVKVEKCKDFAKPHEEIYYNCYTISWSSPTYLEFF